LLQRQNCFEPVQSAGKAHGQRTAAVRGRTAAEQRAGSPLLDSSRLSNTLPNDLSITAHMDKAPFLDDLQQRLSALVEATPAADLQKNLKALLTQQFARLELVTREEFDTQAKVLSRARAKLDELEARLAALEGRR
jgi:BMFP domain-containing protein YqiC